MADVSCRMLRHVIFDWNGTLLDDTWLCVEVLNRVLEATGRPLVTEESYRAVFDFPAERYYRTLGIDFNQHPFEQVSARFIEDYLTHFRRTELRPGTAALLRDLRARGFGLSILSANRQDNLERVVAAYGLVQAVDGLKGTDSIHATGKVTAGIEWIQHLGLPPGQVVLVGDTVHDHEVAQAMGVGCVLIAGGHQSEARLRAVGVPVVADLAALDAWLRQDCPYQK